jgi:tetratricopeptide (TPR) repeat protein
MSATTFCWSIATGLALILGGSQAQAANPLRDSRASAPISTSGADVRLVVEANGVFDSDRSSSNVQTAEHYEPVSAASDRTTVRSWTIDAPHRTIESDSWSSDSSPDASRIGTIIHPDGQIEPAAYYRPAPRAKPQHYPQPPHPIPVTAEEAARMWTEGNRRPTNQEKAVDHRESAKPMKPMQPSAWDDEPAANSRGDRMSGDRLYGPGGLRDTSRDVRSSENIVPPPQRRTGRTPNATVPQAATMKLAMAGVSPKSRPTAAAPGAKIAGTRSAAFAARPTPAGRQAAPQIVQLLEQAHDLAGTAETEAEYSRVVDACRRVMAHEQQGVAADYAKQLASWALNRRGQLYVKAGRKQDAMLDFQASIRLDAKCWRAIHNRGVLLATSGQYEGAFDDFDRTISINPRYAKAYANRAALLVVAGKLELAHRDYEQAAQLDPELVTAHRGLAKVSHQLGDLNEALAHYDNAVLLAPDDAYTVTRRADLLTELGHYAAAADEYEHALALNPRSTAANRSSAWLLATCPDEAIRQPGLAVRRAEAALQLEAEPSAESFDALAAALASRGDFRGAVTTVRRAIQLAPDAERGTYQQRLAMYQKSQSFELRPQRSVRQAGFAR